MIDCYTCVRGFDYDSLESINPYTVLQCLPLIVCGCIAGEIDCGINE